MQNKRLSLLLNELPPAAKGMGLAIIVVGLVGIMTFSAGLTTISPMDRDEPRFAQASKQMVMTGDYVTPRFQESLRAKKPIGIYWLQSASAQVFGIDTIVSYRIPSLIGGLITIIATTVLAALLLPLRQAIFAGLFMATALVVVVESHLAKTDSMLTALITLQQIILWKIRQTTIDRQYVSGKLAALFWGVMGFAILIKGPIAPLIALGTIGLIIAVRREWHPDPDGEMRQWQWVMSLRPMLGMVVLTAIVLPWVVLVTSATDGAFISVAIQGDLVSKLQSAQESHGAPPLTYLMLILITFWPASLVLGRGVRIVWQKRHLEYIIFLLGWILPFWIILEITPTKLPHYNMPTFAALAILAAHGIEASLPPAKALPLKKSNPKARIIERLFGGMKRRFASLTLPRFMILVWEWGFMAVGPILGIALLYIATIADGNRGAAGLALLMALAASLAAFFWHRFGRLRYLIAVLMAGGLMHMTTLGAILPSLEAIRLAPRIKAELAEITPPPSVVTAAGYHEPSLVFLLGVDTLLFTPMEAALFLAEADNGLALIERRSEKDFRQTLAALGIAVETVGSVMGYNISRGQRVDITFYRRSKN